jgi:hypothetical protein
VSRGGNFDQPRRLRAGGGGQRVDAPPLIKHQARRLSIGTGHLPVLLPALDLGID